MDIKKNNIYIADLNPQVGTEAGKKRPVLVVQTDFINNKHSSTIILPITTTLTNASILRVRLPKDTLKYESDVLIDQIRAIDNSRFVSHICEIDRETIKKIETNLNIILS